MIHIRWKSTLTDGNVEISGHFVDSEIAFDKTALPAPVRHACMRSGAGHDGTVCVLVAVMVCVTPYAMDARAGLSFSLLHCSDLSPLIAEELHPFAAYAFLSSSHVLQQWSSERICMDTSTKTFILGLYVYAYRCVVFVV